MTRRLTFSFAALIPLIAHTSSASEGMVLFTDCGDPALFKAGATADADGYAKHADIDAAKVPKGLVLVKDDGAYLMSGGMPRLMLPDGLKSIVVYAKHCDPGKDSDVWNTAQAICGGDDFAERIELEIIDELQQAFSAGHAGRAPNFFTVEFDEDGESLSLGVE